MMQDCCSVHSRAKPAVHTEKGTCRECGQKGKEIGRITLESLLTPGALARLKRVPYYFDSNPECPVVYFSNEPDSYFAKTDLRARVDLKEKSDPVPVC